MKTTLPVHVSIAAAARAMECTRPTINAKIMREELRAEKIAGRWLVIVASMPKAAQKKLLATPSRSEHTT